MKKTKIKIILKGTRPIMFDRFVSMKTELDPMDKVYQKDGKLILPNQNIMSFLSAINTESAPQRVVGRGWKAIARAALSFVVIDGDEIFFTRNGKKINADSVEVVYDKAIIKKGALSIPSEKSRPVLDCPWNLSFTIDLYENDNLNEPLLKKLFDIGGITIGLGTYRGVYGKFIIDKWEITK